MSVQYNKELETMDMNCITCSFSEEFEGTFGECIEQAKKSGWRIYKDKDGNWVHQCEDCKDNKKENS